MPLCVIPGCLEKGIHSFPRDHSLWLKWRKAIIRATYPRVSNSWHPRYVDLICSRHFKPEDLASYSDKALVYGAVPSIFNDKECEVDLEAEINQETELEVENSSKERDLEVETSGKETDLEVEIISKETANSNLKNAEITHQIAKGSSRRVTIFQGENHAPNMCKAINDLRVRTVCCDVSIIVPTSALKNSEGIKFKAHSVVLAARSKFFRTLFMKPENYTHQIITMPNYINGRAVEIVLHYMYTGKLGIRKDTVSTIFQVGWLFQMDDVLMLCKQYCKMKKFTPAPVEVNAANHFTSESSGANHGNETNNDEEKTETECNKEIEVLSSDGNEEMDEIQPKTRKIAKIYAKIAPEINKSVKTTLKTSKITKTEAKIAPKMSKSVKITHKTSKNSEIEAQIAPEANKCVETTPETRKTSETEPETSLTPLLEPPKIEIKPDEMSIIMRDPNCNELRLVEGPPEMIECTPTILSDNLDDDEPNNPPTQPSKERKLIIFKTGTSQTTAINRDLSKPSTENGFGNSDLIVVHFKNNLTYPSPVLYVVHGMKNYTDLLIQHAFFHIEFHVDNNCRKGVVKTDGSLICAMFGQVNHFFPLFHSVTPEDVETYRYDENKPLTFTTRRIVPIKRPTDMTDDWDPIFGRDRDCEKDVLHCFACCCVFFSLQGKASHLLRHHRTILHWDNELNVYKYPCGACDFMCTNLRLLYFHRHQKHDWQLPEVVPQFRCGLCCACETSVHTARDHMVKVHHFAQFSHNLANAAGKKVFLHLVNKDGLKRQLVGSDHVGVGVGDVDVELEQPGEVLPVAMKRVKEKVFQCPECEYSSAYNGNLKSHIKNKHSARKSPRKKKRRRRKNVY